MSKNYFDVTDPWFGARGDGVHDDTTAIQSAITLASTTGGGVVVLPVGTYKVTTTLVISQSNVRLAGFGAGGLHTGTIPDDPATRINWYGGATPCVTFTSVAGTKISASNGMSGISIYNQTNGTIGLNIDTAQSGLYENMAIENFTDHQVAMVGTVVTPDGSGNQHNVFRRFNLAASPSSSTSDCLYLNASSHNTYTTFTYSHASGNGITVVASDFNTFTDFRGARASGSLGHGIELTGSGTSISNLFVSLSAGAGGFTAHTGTSATIINYDSGDNGWPNPIIDTGANVFWIADNGGMNGFRPTGLTFFSDTDVGNGFELNVDPAHPYIANDQASVRGLAINVPTGSTSGVTFRTNSVPNGASVQADGSIAAKYLLVGGTGVALTGGSGAPTFAAPVGTIYQRWDGSAGTLLYVSKNALVSAWNAFA
jgi:hypothetical protein